MTPKAQIRFENATWGLLLGSFALLVVLYCTLNVAGPGGEITPTTLLEQISWLVYVVFTVPAGWVTERLFHRPSWAAIVVLWLECVTISWLLMTACRLVVSKWRET